MMNIKHTALVYFIGFMLSGCAKEIPTASCSSSETQKLIRTLLTEQAERLTVAKRNDQYDGSSVFGAVKINTLLNQIQVVLENVKTLKEDSNSRQSFCSGQLQVTVPPSMLADVDYVRDAQHQPKIAQYAKQLNIENSNNVFSQNVEYKAEYTLQPNAEEGKDLHVDFENDAWVHLLDEITTAALLKPTLNGQEANSVQLNEQPKPEVESVKPEAAEQAKFDAEKLKAMQIKQGLNKLNQELREEEQVQKTLPKVIKEQVSEQVARPLVAPVTATKQTAPSFDCSKARRSTDIAVCTNPELVALDLKNMKLYKKAKAMNAAATKEIFNASIKLKYACGANVECIKQVYQKSILNYGCVADGKALDCGAAVPQESEGEGVTQ